MIPELIMWACRIVAHIDRVDELDLGIRCHRVGAFYIRVAEIGELGQVALAAERTRDTHWIAGLEQE
jgi:hypothetical protein